MEIEIKIEKLDELTEIVNSIDGEFVIQSGVGRIKSIED